MCRVCQVVESRELHVRLCVYLYCISVGLSFISLILILMVETEE